MKRLSKKAIALLSIPAGFLLSLLGSCGHRVYNSPPCVYGPPPEEIREQKIQERSVVYGPPPAMKIRKDSIDQDSLK